MLMKQFMISDFRQTLWYARIDKDKLLEVATKL